MDFETKCIICGSTLEVAEDKTTCPNCHYAHLDSVSKTDMATIAEGFDALSNHNYSEAYDTFSKVVKKHPDLSIGYYGLILAKYYVYSVSSDKVCIDAVRPQNIFVDTDYVDMLKCEKGELKSYLMNVCKLIDSEAKRVEALALSDKPYSVAIYDTTDHEVYKYLDNLGYDIYSEHIPTSREKLVDEYNVYSNAKLMILCVDSEDKLVEYSKSIVVNKYTDKFALGEVADNSLLVVTNLSEEKVLAYIPYATVLNSDKKTLLFDIESIANSILGKVEVVAPKVKVKTKKATESNLNTSGYNSIIRGLGIAALVIFAVLTFMYTFTGSYYLAIGIGNIFILGFTITTLVLSTIVFVKAHRNIKYILVMALSSFIIVASLIGMCSAFFTRGGADWCYQGMWYVENNKSVEITNVDYYYTMFNRNIEVPETLKGKDVVSFKVEHHSDIYSVVNVSERLKTITIDSCSNIKSVTISAMNINADSIYIKNCEDLEKVSIKNCDKIGIHLYALEDLDVLILKDIRVISALALYNLDELDEIWLPIHLEDLSGFTIDRMDELDVYTSVTNVITYLRGLGYMTYEGSINVESLSIVYERYQFRKN